MAFEGGSMGLTRPRPAEQCPGEVINNGLEASDNPDIKSYV